MDKPLHVKVAEALGWELTSDGLSIISPEGGRWALNRSTDPVPHYDTDWSATGPLIERYWIDLQGFEHDGVTDRWNALVATSDIEGAGPTPLIAVCNLILALSASGKLSEPVPTEEP